jgi:hypothetical protein
VISYLEFAIASEALHWLTRIRRRCFRAFLLPVIDR